MPFQRPLGSAVEGFFSLYSGFTATDNTRVPRWAVNFDSWCLLSGYVLWTEANTSVTAGEQRTFGGVGLTGTPAQPPGIRDWAGVSKLGPVHFAIFPTGKLYFRFQTAVTLVQNDTWFSFDQSGFRIY